MDYEFLEHRLTSEQVSKGWILLYGETLIDMLTKKYILLVGDCESGKSTMAEYLPDINPRIKHVNPEKMTGLDRLMFNKNVKKAYTFTIDHDQAQDFATIYKENEQYNIDLVIELKTKNEKEYFCLHAETIAYIKNELGIKIIEMKRIEGKIEKTAKRLNELLKKH